MVEEREGEGLEVGGWVGGGGVGGGEEKGGRERGRGTVAVFGKVTP